MPRRRPTKHLPDGTINPLWQPVKQRRRTSKPVVLSDPRAEALARVPLRCANCDAITGTADVFCNFRCRAEAKYVRYYRKKVADGSFMREDVREALRFRLAHILSGGYDPRLRVVPAEVRAAVMERSNGRCQRCGREGAELDHIEGPSPAPDNLQWLCSDCHDRKTSRRLQPISKENDPELWAKADSLDVRAFAEHPLRLCDDPSWDKLWRSIRSCRLRVMKEL